MSTREKILVGLMIAAVCLGSLMLFSGGQKPKTLIAASDETNSLTRMLTNLAAQFGSDKSLEVNRYTLSMARTPWQDTLFLDGDSLLSSSSETAGPTDVLPSNVSLVYTGYIETTQRRVAIINGIEYVEGDQLDKSVYTVRQITPDQVTVGSPQQQVFSVPLIDNWEAQTP